MQFPLDLLGANIEKKLRKKIRNKPANSSQMSKQFYSMLNSLSLFMPCSFIY